MRPVVSADVHNAADALPLVTEVCFTYDTAASPVITVSPGSEVIFETQDARCGRMRRAEDAIPSAPDWSSPFPAVDPATGPVGLEGAEPGDVIKVTILELQLASQGFLIVKPDMGILRGIVDEPVGRIVAIGDASVVFDAGLEMPLRPMLGIIGTAPASGKIPSSRAHRAGGNIDNPRVSVGASVYLPVEVPLGLLYVGDAHAAMGDGEVCGLGVEAFAAARVRVDLLHGRSLANPIVENEEVLVTHGIAPTYYAAASSAISQMLDVLEPRLPLSRHELYMLASGWGNLRPNQTCNAAGLDLVVRFEVPRAPLGLETWLT